MSRTVRSPSRASTCPVCSPTPHSAATGSGCRNSRTPSAGTMSSPSGLDRVDASLAMNLDGATPTEQVMPCCSAIVARISAPIAGGRPEPPDGPGHVEERLVERERLHLGGDRPEDLHDLLGHGRVRVMPGRDEDRLRAQPPGPRHRHGRMHPERPRLVGRGEDHAAAGGRAHDHRLPGQFGPVTDLDAGVEGVHVHVQDVAAGVGRLVAHGSRARRSGPAARGSSVPEHVELGGEVVEGRVGGGSLLQGQQRVRGTRVHVREGTRHQVGEDPDPVCGARRAARPLRSGRSPRPG